MLTSEKPDAAEMSHINTYLIQVFAHYLNVSSDALTEEESFFSLGLTSLIHAEVLACLQKTFGELSSTVLFEFPNLALLQDYLYEKQVTQESLRKAAQQFETSD